MSDESKEILRILEQNFPEPKPDLDRMGDADVNYELASLMASNAVNLHDAQFRVEMAESVAKKLLYGESLLVPDRAWLLYILKKIGPSNLPNEHRGRAPTSSLDKLEMMCRLGKIMADLENSQPGMTQVMRHREAGKILNKSYETIRKLYFSDEYKALAGHPFFYRFCVENEGINK